MNLSTFLHRDSVAPTTISEIKRLHEETAASDFLGLYAYATHSGAALFDLAFSGQFWGGTRSRWLFGIDYGRTQPQALRFLSRQANLDIRINDGQYLVGQKGFMPRRDFHAEVAMFINHEAPLAGMVVGSGNFSSNGLRKSVEAGASIITRSIDDFGGVLRPTFTAAELLWEQATPLADIVDTYEEVWSASFLRRVANLPTPVEEDQVAAPIFWIEAGHVTKNRGPNRPGNQIDLPRGMSRYFGFNPPPDLPTNSVIGEVTFETPAGGAVTKNLRLGNNMMEKVTLPIPETHGFDIYDGKILVFQQTQGRFVMRALEADDFETAFGDRLAGVRVMGSGRRYGRVG